MEESAKVIWGSGAEVQGKSLATVRSRIAPGQNRCKRLFLTSALEPQRPLALSPNHFGGCRAHWGSKCLDQNVGRKLRLKGCNDNDLIHRNSTHQRCLDTPTKQWQRKLHSFKTALHGNFKLDKVYQEPEKNPKAKKRTNSTKEFSEQFEGTTQ